MSTAPVKNSVIFVCMGNTCRSPMAEAIFIHLLKQKGIEHDWIVSSAATLSYLVGQPPNVKTIECLKSHGITDFDHTARLLTAADLQRFQHIMCMDDHNIEHLVEYETIVPKDQMDACNNRVHLLGSYDPMGEMNIRDPYFTNEVNDFEHVFQQCYRSCDEFLKQNTA